MVFFIATVKLCNQFFKNNNSNRKMEGNTNSSIFLSYSQPLVFQFVPKNTYLQEQVFPMQYYHLISAFHQLFYISLKNSLNLGKLSLSSMHAHKTVTLYKGKEIQTIMFKVVVITSKFITNLQHLLMIFIVVDDATSNCRSCIMLHIFYNTGLIINSAGFKDVQSAHLDTLCHNLHQASI